MDFTFPSTVLNLQEMPGMLLTVGGADGQNMATLCSAQPYPLWLQPSLQVPLADLTEDKVIFFWSLVFLQHWGLYIAPLECTDHCFSPCQRHNPQLTSRRTGKGKGKLQHCPAAQGQISSLINYTEISPPLCYHLHPSGIPAESNTYLHYMAWFHSYKQPFFFFCQNKT